jgi:hypothetical protein
MNRKIFLKALYQLRYYVEKEMVNEMTGKISFGCMNAWRVLH